MIDLSDEAAGCQPPWEADSGGVNLTAEFGDQPKKDGPHESQVSATVELKRNLFTIYYRVGVADLDRY